MLLGEADHSWGWPGPAAAARQLGSASCRSASSWPMVRDDSALLAAMLSRWLSCARSTLSAAARQRSDGAGRADAELPVSTLWYLGHRVMS